MGSARGRRANDDSPRGRSRSNASETPSTMMSGHPPYSRSINHLKGKNKERRGSTADASSFDVNPDSSIYPLLYPYPIPIPTNINEPFGFASPGPSESRPKPRTSKASFCLPTSRLGKRLSGNKNDLDDTPEVAYDHNRINPPAYLTANSGSDSADLINSRYFATEFVLPLFADREVILEWKGSVVSGSSGREEVMVPDHLTDAQKWNGLVYGRAGRPKVDESKSLATGSGGGREGTAAPAMTLEVKKEETYGEAGPDAVSPIKSTDPGKANAVDEAVVDSPLPERPDETDGPVDQDEAAAEMDIDMQLLGDEGDGPEAGTDTGPSQSASIAVDGLREQSNLEVETIGASPVSLPNPSTITRSVMTDPVGDRPTQRGLPLQIGPMSGQSGGPERKYSNRRFDESEIEPNFDEPEPKTIDLLTSKPLPSPLPYRVMVPSQSAEIPRRMSSGRPQLADLLNDESAKPLRPSASPVANITPLVRSPPPPSSMAFMLNSPSNFSRPNRATGSPAPFTRTALGNMEIPAYRGSPSWPPPMPMSPYGRPQLSPQANVNLQGRNIAHQGFHLIPIMGHHPHQPHPAHFAYAGPPMQYPSRRVPDHPPRLASRSPTPPRMSTGPVEIPPDMVVGSHVHRPMPFQMASPFLDDAQEDITEADTEVETPATPPRPKRGNAKKTVVESPVDITKPDLMPSSSRSNSNSSPDRPSRMAKAQSKRGRGRSTGSSRTREGSSVKLSSQSTPSVPPRLQSPAPTIVSARPQPKQKRKLSTVNEVYRGQDASSKKANTNKALFSSATSSSRNSVSGPDPRTGSQMLPDIDVDDHPAAESEDELLLGPEGHQEFDDHIPKRKTSSSVLDSQSYINDSSSRLKETNYKKKAAVTMTPVGPAKATRSNDVANGSTRRRTRNR
jgi:hypothetical protein